MVSSQNLKRRSKVAFWRLQCSSILISVKKTKTKCKELCKKRQSQTLAKMWADTRLISGCVYELKCYCACHMELAWHSVETLCWRLFCSKMPGKCSFNHKWLLIWFVKNDSFCLLSYMTFHEGSLKNKFGRWKVPALTSGWNHIYCITNHLLWQFDRV